MAMSTSTPRVDLGVLVAEGDAADQQRDVELVVDAVFARSSPATWAASSRVGSRMSVRGMRARARPLLQHRQHRQREGRGLAGAGLGDAEDVAACQHVRDGLRLDRRRLGVAGGFDACWNFLAQSEFGERHENYNRWGLRRFRSRPHEAATNRRKTSFT